jgi:mannose-6-phosphate isomerase-like protein (cupin superfamily)
VKVSSLAAAEPFTTKDGSTIRELLYTAGQSLAEATLEAGRATARHYHRRSEEIYFVLDGAGEIEIDGERRGVAPGDAVLIPTGARHQITAETRLRFLCCCAPPYAHDDTFLDK